MIGTMASRVRKPPGVRKSQRNAADAVRAWPRDRGLAVVCGGGPVWTRTVLGEPTSVMRVDGCGTKWLADGRECAAPFSVGRGAMEDVRAAVEWGARQNRERGARK